MSVRFHLDESMPNAVADGLRRRGLDVTTSGDAGLLSAGDEPFSYRFGTGLAAFMLSRALPGSLKNWG